MELNQAIKESFYEAKDLYSSFLSEEVFFKTAQAGEMIADCLISGGKLISAGNGGSTCDAIHFAEEFTGRYRKDRPALPAIALAEPAYLTCVGNDFGFKEVFRRGVEAYGKPGDIFVGISTSGNSENIILAQELAKIRGLKTIALLGKDGGKMKGLADIEFIAPGRTADRIQEIHMVVLHIIIEAAERKMYPYLYY